MTRKEIIRELNILSAIRRELRIAIENDALKRTRERVLRMTVDEMRQSVIDAGIFDADGELTERYGGKPKERKT